MPDIEIILPNALTLDEHVERITQCRTRVQVALFDFVDAIRLAHDQLGVDMFERELAQRLGMATSTLNRWKSIGNSQLIQQNREKLPPVFSSLYEITQLEKGYGKFYGETDGPKKLQSLINRRSITPETETKDIKHFVDEVRRQRLDINRQKKEQFLLEKGDAAGYQIDQTHKSLAGLIENGVKVRTIVIFPPNEKLTHWSDMGVMNSDINREFPISEIRGRSERDAINLLVVLPNHRIDVGIKLLKASGFNYRETFFPPNHADGFVGDRNSKVVLLGQRGRGETGKDLSSSNLSTNGVVELAEHLGEGPYLMLYGKVEKEDWICLANPI